MAGNREGALKGARSKRESGFDFSAVGATGGKKRTSKKKGFAALKESDPEKLKRISSKAGQKRHKPTE